MPNHLSDSPKPGTTRGTAQVINNSPKSIQRYPPPSHRPFLASPCRLGFFQWHCLQWPSRTPTLQGLPQLKLGSQAQGRCDAERCVAVRLRFAKSPKRNDGTARQGVPYHHVADSVLLHSSTAPLRPARPARDAPVNLTQGDDESLLASAKLGSSVRATQTQKGKA